MNSVKSVRCVASIALLALLMINGVASHSWVHCTDYRINSQADADYYKPENCKAYPRAWSQIYDPGVFGTDTGFNFQATENQACRDRLGSAPDYGYTTKYPMATYAQNQMVCLAWPSKNHVAETCTNPYIPDTALEIYVSASPTGTADPSQAQFKQTLVKNLTDHVNGQIDFKGFQNCPKFCENMDKSLCTRCFNVPSNLQSGKVYTFQWYWVFNQGVPAYTTCWEAMIGSGNGNTGSTSSSSTTGRPATTTAASTTGRTNPSTTGAVLPPPICNGNTGSGSGTGLPTGGESVAVSSAPFIIPNSGSFDVIVAYSAAGSRLLTVDVLDTKANPTWYGKGTATVSAGSGTASVRVTISNTPPTGPNYVLRAWSIDSKFANDAAPWTYELSRNDYSVSVGGASAFYAASTTPCEDTTPCADLCGGEDQVDSCNCDETGHVSVLCKDTPAPVAAAASPASSLSLSPVVAVVAAVASLIAAVML